NSFPQPNGKDLGNGLAEFAASYTNTSRLDATSVRIDHSIGQKWSVFGRYNNAPSEGKPRDIANLSLLSLTRFVTQTVTIGATGALTSHSSNEFRFNFSDNTGKVSEAADNFSGAVPVSIAAALPSQFVSDTSSFSWSLFFPGRTARILPQVFLTKG